MRHAAEACVRQIDVNIEDSNCQVLIRLGGHLSDCRYYKTQTGLKLLRVKKTF